MTPPEPKRLLVVDDDEDLRYLFTRAMEKTGYAVASAEDGELGLAKAKVFRPHLIVLDLMMPKLSGFEVLRRLQAEGFGDIPIVIISGFSDEASEQLIRQEPNVVDFLRKPIKYADLPALIGRLLSR